MFEETAVSDFSKFDENSKSIGPGSSINPKSKKQHRHIYIKKCLPRHIAIELLKSGDEEKNLKSSPSHSEARR